MSEKTIKNIEGLIQQYDPSKQVSHYEVINMTIPGENYAGVMLRVDATLKGNGTEETIHGVAKTPNFTVHEFFREHIPTQYRKEVSFYREMIPTLQAFYREQSGEELPDIFPKLYAARFNLNEDETIVDEHAVILLENLVKKGYRNIDRHIGFDLEEAKLILKDVATFHAVPVALKLKKPEVFETKIKKQADTKMIHKRPPSQPGKNVGPRPDTIWYDSIKRYDEATPYLEALKKLFEAGFQGMSPAEEPFATIGHNDLWTNNTMQIIENGKVIKNKLIDFQMLSYQSPIKDLLFFLSTSLQLHLLDEHFDDLIKCYHQYFTETLKKCKCESNDFKWVHFKQELNKIAPKELSRIIRMLVPIFAKKGQPAFDTTKVPEIKPEMITDLAKERGARIVVVFGKRGWL